MPVIKSTVHNINAGFGNLYLKGIMHKIRAAIVIKWVKPPPEILTSNMRALGRVLTAPLIIHLSTVVPGKTAKDSPSGWAQPSM